MDRSLVLLAPDIGRNEAHRTRPVEGDSRDQIFKAVRLELFHETLHTGRFKLEDAVAFTGRDISVHIRVICPDTGYVEHPVFQFRGLLPHTASMAGQADLLHLMF